MSSARAASATGSSGQHECSWCLPALSGAAGVRLVGGGSVRARSLARVGPLPLLALSVRLVRPPPLRLRLRMLANRRVRPGGGSLPGGDSLTPDRDHSPQPGPLGLGSGLWSSPGAARSRLGFGGRSSPASSGAVEYDHSGTFDSVDLDWDDSFRAVLHLIREFHSMEELASVALNRCRTSLAPVYGLPSESSPALHLPLSLRTQTRLWPSSWKNRLCTGFSLFLVVAIGNIIGLPPPLFLVRIWSRLGWPPSPLKR